MVYEYLFLTVEMTSIFYIWGTLKCPRLSKSSFPLETESGSISSYLLGNKSCIILFCFTFFSHIRISWSLPNILHEFQSFPQHLFLKRPKLRCNLSSYCPSFFLHSLSSQTQSSSMQLWRWKPSSHLLFLSVSLSPMCIS